MSAVFRRRGVQELVALVAALLAAAAVVTAKPRKAGAAETFTVAVDQAQLMRVPSRTSTIVIGNPLIADVSLQAGGILVVTGKGYGSTNFLALDRGGNVLTEKLLVVSAPTDNVVSVYTGVERSTYSCEPQCQPRVMLGDTSNFFNATLAQTGTRNGTASSGGGPNAAPALR